MSTSNLDLAPLDSDPEFTFRFIEFNPRRNMRRVEAARIEVIVDGVPDDVLRMSQKDIQNNLEIFGQHPALLTALAYYTGAIPIILTPQPEAA
jgi:hypothetical protein